MVLAQKGLWDSAEGFKPGKRPSFRAQRGKGWSLRLRLKFTLKTESAMEIELPLNPAS